MHEDVHRCQGGSHILQLTCKEDLVGNVQLCCQMGKAFRIPIADFESRSSNDQELSAWISAADHGSCPDKTVDAFPRPQPAGHTDDRAICWYSETGPQPVLVFDGLEPVWIDPIVNDADFSAERQVFGNRVRVGEDRIGTCSDPSLPYSVQPGHPRLSL